MSDYTKETDSADPPWCIGVFASRETPGELKATLIAILAAVHKTTTVDILINGNRNLADNSKKIIATLSKSNNLANCRLWFIPLGDKAHAWNVYLHNIWPGDGPAYFIDGYARPNANALALLEQGLRTNTNAFGASGVPTVGRTAAKLRAGQIEERGIHGNLFCLRADTISNLRNIGFHLPLGLYRTDSTIGAVLKYSLNPISNSWNPERIFVDSQATWATDVKYWWSYSELKGQFKRLIRQAQGDLENRAVRHHLSICKRAPQDMPEAVVELVEIWLKENPMEATTVLKSLLRRHALKQLQRPRDWSLAALPAELIEIASIN